MLSNRCCQLWFFSFCNPVCLSAGLGTVLDLVCTSLAQTVLLTMTMQLRLPDKGDVRLLGLNIYVKMVTVSMLFWQTAVSPVGARYSRFWMQLQFERYASWLA